MVVLLDVITPHDSLCILPLCLELERAGYFSPHTYVAGLKVVLNPGPFDQGSRDQPSRPSPSNFLPKGIPRFIPFIFLFSSSFLQRNNLQLVEVCIN